MNYLPDIKGIWITWEFQRRNLGISAVLGWQLYQIEFHGHRVKRYYLSLFKTTKILFSTKPDIVAIQNPSVVLATFSVIMAWILGFKLIMDAHNSGVYPAEGRSHLLMALASWLQKRSDLVIVTNDALKSVVESNGGRCVVLPDKIIDPPANIKNISLDGKVSIVYICTFSNDEPFREVALASSLLGKDIVIYFTGRFQGKLDPDSLSGNVRLMGFIPEDEYWELLNSADIIMDLTLRDNCLVCGAYESISLDKPLILSDTYASRMYFNMGCIYVESSAQSIANGIQQAVETLPNMRNDIKKLHNNLDINWLKSFDKFVLEINRIISWVS